MSLWFQRNKLPLSSDSTSSSAADLHRRRPSLPSVFLGDDEGVFERSRSIHQRVSIESGRSTIRRTSLEAASVSLDKKIQDITPRFGTS